MSGQFTSVGTVASMLARSHKHLAFDIYDLIEWCGEAVKNIGNFESLHHYHPDRREDQDICRIKVINKQALLPCGIYRLLSIRHRKRPLNATEYIRNDSYIRFVRDHYFHDDHEIEIEFLGIPVDKDGFPKIDEVALQACYWYCLKMMSLEDYMNGKISGDVWAMIDTEYGKYVQKAKQSFKNVSRNDMDEIAMIMYNMVPKIRLPLNMT